MVTEEIPLADAAAELKKSWGQAWQLVLTGVLKGRKVAGKWMVSKDSIRAFKEADSRTA